MNPLAKLLCPALFWSALLPAQPIPAYSSVEEYCYKNPNAPTCKDGKPINFDPKLMYDNAMKGSLQVNGKATPSTTTTTTAVPVPRATPTPITPLRMPEARTRRGSPTDIRLGELDWRLLEPHADLYIGLNMSGLLDAELSRTLISEWSTKLGATQDERDKLLTALGDVSQAVISVNSNGILAVLIGRLESFPEITTVGKLQMRRISADTVLIGTDWTLRFAMHRLSFPLESAPHLLEAQQLAQRYHFWACGRPQGFSAFGQGVPPNTPVSKIAFGVSFRDGFRMDMDLDTPNYATATRLMQASAKSIPRGMESSVQGGSLHYSLAIDRDTALQRFSGFMSDSTGKQFAPLLTAARQIASRKTAGTRTAPGKIVIDGLDDGPKEVTPGTKQ